MQKDNTKSYWLISGLYAFFEKSATYLFGFGSVFILYRVLEVSEMGIWVLFLTICAFLEVTRMGLIQNALVKFLSSEDEHLHGEINTASLFLNFVLTAFFAVFLYLLAPFWGYIFESPSIIPLLHLSLIHI